MVLRAHFALGPGYMRSVLQREDLMLDRRHRSADLNGISRQNP
jgi:hypothetical protein